MQVFNIENHTFVILVLVLEIGNVKMYKKKLPWHLPRQFEDYPVRSDNDIEVLIFFVRVSNPAFVFNKGFFKSFEFERVAF